MRYEERLQFHSIDQARELAGVLEENFKQIEKSLQVEIVARGQEATIFGEKENVRRAHRLLEHLQGISKKRAVAQSDVQYAISVVSPEHEGEDFEENLEEVLAVTAKGKQIRPKTLGQLHYVQSIAKKDITFGIGPAGTGKTYLAVVMAVKALKARKVERIILTRPAVEAGEKLGFLPGDLQDKVDPYLRPLYDGLYDVLGIDTAQKYLERQIIEIAPLAYMRGRTLDDAFIILDEAQNTTTEQMKMFLTRIGFGSKAVVTGDITQVDLPRSTTSGLLEVERILGGIEEIGFHYLTAADVVRHPIVGKIIRAYEKFEA